SDTRPERPKPWYGLLSQTHWPGRIPPGNRPFYVPEWALEVLGRDGRVDEAGSAALIKAVKAAGFRPAVAHVCYLPETSEYLAAAMRLVETHAWTVNPITYRL